MPGSKPPQERIVSTYCYQCVAGPDLLTVRIQDGVATEINPNFKAAAMHPGGGKVCVKAFGLVQKAYNPNRVLHPMKRTNPKKGRDEDPGFVRISWDEALDLVADKLKAARAAGLTDANGFPRLAASFGGGGTPTAYMGTLPAFLSAGDPVDLSFGSGQGVKCTHSEHLYGEFWHRAFTVSPDTPLCDYLVVFRRQCRGLGRRVRRQAPCRRAQARHEAGADRAASVDHRRLLGRVGPDQAEDGRRVPVRHDPRAAARTPRATARPPFLKARTSSPYLIGPNGFFLRDPDTRKPLVIDHDQRAGGAVRHRRYRSGA